MNKGSVQRVNKPQQEKSPLYTVLSSNLACQRRWEEQPSNQRILGLAPTIITINMEVLSA